MSMRLSGQKMRRRWALTRANTLPQSQAAGVQKSLHAPLPQRARLTRQNSIGGQRAAHHSFEDSGGIHGSDYTIPSQPPEMGRTQTSLPRNPTHHRRLRQFGRYREFIITPPRHCGTYQTRLITASVRLIERDRIHTFPLPWQLSW